MIAGKGIVTQTEYQKHIRGNWRTAHGIWEKIRNYVPSFGYSKAEVDALIANMVSSTVVLADHTLLRGDGGVRGIQDSGIVIDDADNISNIGTLEAAGITDTAVTATNMAAGTVGQRPGGTVGDIRYNSTLGEFELYIAAWHNLIRSSANVVLGTIGCDEITVADGHGINLQEDITFLGATTENKIMFPDNLPVALDFTEAGNSYLKFVTTNAGEKVVFGKLFEAPTACKIGNLTLANGSITDSGGTISFGNEN
jgi:hypothetical protein